MTFQPVIVIPPENQINIFGGYSVYSSTACSLLLLKAFFAKMNGMLRFLSRFYLKSGWIEPSELGGHAPP